jgi:hypothetical protein
MNRVPASEKIIAQGYEKPKQLCLNSPDLEEILKKDIKDYFNGDTNYSRSYGDYFVISSHDNQNYCQCQLCQAKIKSDSQVKGYKGKWWSDKTSNYVWGFVDRFARYEKEKHPGKWVTALSYARYSLPPDQVEIVDNVAVLVARVLIEGIFDPEYKEFYRNNIRAWAARTRRWYLWEYFDHVQGYRKRNFFPGIFTREITSDARFLRENG